MEDMATSSGDKEDLVAVMFDFVVLYIITTCVAVVVAQLSYYFTETKDGGDGHLRGQRGLSGCVA